MPTSRQIFDYAESAFRLETMPPVSESQRRLMHAAAADPAVAKRTGVPRAVAKEFAAADKTGKLPERKKPKGKKL